MPSPLTQLSDSAKRYEDTAATLIRQAGELLGVVGSEAAISGLLSEAQWNLGTAAGLRAAASVLTTKEVSS